MIELENHSPFPHFLYEKTGYRGKPFDVLAVKGTFRLKADLSMADLAEGQSPPVMADVHWGEAETSSLKFETDLVIAKQRTDIHVIGHAHAEQGQPARRWLAGIRVGALRKPLHVTGPRVWHHASGRWQLGEPEPVESVPLRYELAYGGQYRPEGCQGAAASLEAAQPGPVVYRPNPIGLGFLDPAHLSTDRHYPAPQIESADPACAIADIRQRYPPEGFGPLSRGWEPRARYAGTYDAAWQQSRWPFLPDDFDFAFYQSAPAGLQAQGFLQGDEPVVLVGLLPEAQSVATALAGYTPVCVVEDGGNTLHTLFPRLGTVTFDTDRRLIHQTWHLTLPRDFAARHIVLGTLVPPPEHCGDLRRKFARDAAHG